MADGVSAPRWFVQAPRSPVAVGVGAAILAGWLLLLGMVLTREGLAEADPAVLDWLVRHRSGGATAVFEAVSSVAVDAVAVALAAAWVVLVAVRVRSAWPVATLVAAVGAAGVLSILVKSAVHRARPATATMLAAPETGWSFPSGHTVVGTAVAGAVVLVVWRSRRSVPCGRARCAWPSWWPRRWARAGSTWATTGSPTCWRPTSWPEGARPRGGDRPARVPSSGRPRRLPTGNRRDTGGMTTTSPPQPGDLSLPARPGWPDATGHFGVFGGRFVPEALIAALDELTEAYEAMRVDPAFLAEFDALQRDYTGRPSPITEVPRFAEHAGGARVLLKREDLNHTGSHKINNVLGQALLTKRIGKKRVIAETGAGQHGVATATAAALMGLSCTVYMGEEDTRRQALNVARMRLLGAEVIPVTTGSRTLKDAINEAFRDWVTNVETTNYVFGTVAGPHPFPAMVRDFQRVIGDEARAQVLEREGRLPDAVLACVGGGSNAIGIFTAFVPDDGVRLVGLEAGGDGVDTGRHAATITGGDAGRAARRALLPAAGRQRADRRVALDQRRPGLPRRRARAQLPARHRPRRVPPGHRRRGHGGLRAALPHRGHHPGDRDARTPWPARWSLGRELRAGRAAAGQPVRPRGQGRRDGVAPGSASATATHRRAGRRSWTPTSSPPTARSRNDEAVAGQDAGARREPQLADRIGAAQGRGPGGADRLPPGRLPRRRRPRSRP